LVSLSIPSPLTHSTDRSLRLYPRIKLGSTPEQFPAERIGSGKSERAALYAITQSLRLHTNIRSRFFGAELIKAERNHGTAEQLLLQRQFRPQI
jgi:hypothetical protein